MPRTLTKIPPHVSFRLRYLFQDKGVTGKELLKLYPEYSRTILYQQAVKSIDSRQVVDKRKFNKGRPKESITKGGKNYFMRNAQIKGRIWVICYQEATVGSGLGNKVCDEIVTNLLKKKGYKFLYSRKKGLLKPKDLKERQNVSQKN